MAIETPKLKLLLIQEDWKFADDSFNLVISDMDNKLLGIAHGDSNVHWSGWQTGYSYSKGDIVRTESCKSNQYYLCVTNGISGVIEPANNITGSVVDDGTVQWKICILGDSEASAAVDIFRGGMAYNKGQLVLYNEVLYRCKVGHVAAMTMELDADKWQQVDASLQPWKQTVYFFENDIVVYDNVIYKCIQAHTSGYTFDPTKWTPLSITLINDWQADTDYLANQIVLYEGILYRALDAHTSDATDFSTDLAVPHWEYICASIPEWKAEEGYLVGQVVLYNNRLYKCITAHTATTTFDFTKWASVLATPVIDDWQVDTNYLEGQLIKFNDMLLIAVDTHTSDSTDIINDLTNPNIHWNLVYANIQTWQANIAYKVGTQVIYNNNLYQAKDTHTSGSTFDIAHWELIGQFDAFIYDWQANKYYYANQVVIKDKELYRSDSNHTSANTWGDDKVNWTKISSAVVIDNWADNTEYLLNEVVIWNGVLYRCNTAHTSSTTFDDAKFTPVYANVAPWQASTEYLVDQLVMYNNQLYKCITAHTSASTFEPDGAKWQPVANNIAGIPAWASGVYYYQNQIVKYNGKIWRCLTAHISGIEDTPEMVKLFNYSSQFMKIEDTTALPVDVVFDLGTSNKINKVQLDSSDNGPDVTFELYIGVDGVNYRLINTFVQGNHSGSNLNLDTYADVRYVKIKAVSYFDGYGYGGHVELSNLRIFGDSSRWEVIVDPDIKITYWSQNTRYKKDEIVIYDDEFYKCINTNFSGTTFNTSDWKKIPRMIIPDWKANEGYILNQVVFYDGKLYKCIVAHTSSSTFTQANWTPVNDFIDTWQVDKYYYTNQVVWYNNSLWRVILNHKSETTNKPDEKLIYESTSNILYTDDTTVIPNSEIIDLGSVYQVTKITQLVYQNEMTAQGHIELSEDGINYHRWRNDIENARYIKFINDSVSIDVGATNPYFYLSDVKVYANSDSFEEVSTMNTLTDNDIDEMFV